MIKTIAISPYHDIYMNIALERQLFDNFNGQDMLLLWSNNPCVVCGRNQNVYDEVNLPFASQNNISISRRYSGGGAVYQDRGNLNYTIYTTSDDISAVIDSVLQPLKQLGIVGVINGRNDITVGEKKVSGFAYYSDDKCNMYHGTLLVDVDMASLAGVLSPSKLKLSQHAIKSVSSRVVNLSKVADVTVDSITSAISSYHISAGTSVVGVELHDLSRSQQLADNSWIFGESPDFTAQYELLIGDSIYNICVKVHNDVIISCDVYSDSLNVDNVDMVKSKLLAQSFQRFDDIIVSLQQH